MILLVEDDDNNRFAVEDLLSIEGYNVLSASGGRDALDLLHKHRKEICLIICDIKMPGITGYNIIQEVKRLYPDIPFIFISAYASPSDVNLGYRLGCDRYIVKPFGVKELLDIVRDLLKKI